LATTTTSPSYSALISCSNAGRSSTDLPLAFSAMIRWRQLDLARVILARAADPRIPVFHRFFAFT
jgi:hypothetical protein